MRRKTTARGFFSILLNSWLALFAFGVSAVGLPFGPLPVSSAIAEEPGKQVPSSEVQRNEALQQKKQLERMEHTEHRNEALQQMKAL